MLTWKLQCKLFDSIVKPIMLYGCQVWGQQIINHILKADFGQFDKLPFEELQNKLCKFSLGVGKYTSNLACRAELGRYPILISACSLAIKFWKNLLESPDKLSHCAYKEELKLNIAGQNNWAGFIKQILHRCNMDNIWVRQKVNRDENIQVKVRNALKSQYSNIFFDRLNMTTGTTGKTGNKLRTYKLVKNEYEAEHYLTRGLSFRVARAIAKLRLSAHDLAIETGRRARPHVPASERYCKFCTGQVEDEIHFLIQCPMYQSERQQLYNVFKIDRPTSMDVIETFRILMCSDQTEELNSLGNFILNAFNLRKDSHMQ